MAVVQNFEVIAGKLKASVQTEIIFGNWSLCYYNYEFLIFASLTVHIETFKESKVS
jgi:hypothetical protein